MRKILPLGGLSSLLPNLRLRRQHYVRCCCCYTATKLLLLHYVRCCCCYRTYFSASAPSLAAAELLKRKLPKKCCIYQPPVPKVVGHSACQKAAVAVLILFCPSDSQLNSFNICSCFFMYSFIISRLFPHKSSLKVP